MTSPQDPDLPKSRRERGSGRIFRRWYRDAAGQRRQVDTWTIQYYVNGRHRKESTAFTDYGKALARLQLRLGEVRTGTVMGPEVERTTYAQLETLLLDDYKINGRKSLDRIEDACTRLREFFGESKAREITTERTLRYVRQRQEIDQAKNATINRELAALKRMWTLGIRARLVALAQRPYIGLLEERNTRKGFFEPEAFQAMLAHLPADLVPLFDTAYITGWRVRDELLTRQKHHADLGAGWLRMEPGETKNGEGRMFPLVPELRRVLEQQLARTADLERATGRIIPWLFHRDGRPIKSYRRAWHSACRRAGLAGRIPHDFRRTAVRNLERASVPRSAAMAMVGHRTEAIYRRYAIVDETVLREGAQKLAMFQQAERRRLQDRRGQ